MGRATVVGGGWEGVAAEVAREVVIDAADVEVVERTVVESGGGGVMGTAVTSGAVVEEVVLGEGGAVGE